MALRVVVFGSGAILMGLEIVGSRLIAPFFGSSVFVWGGLISIFLGALIIAGIFTLAPGRIMHRVVFGG